MFEAARVGLDEGTDATCADFANRAKCRIWPVVVAGLSPKQI